MPSAPDRVTVVRPPRQFAQIRLDEIWAYRSLLFSLIDRRLKTQFESQVAPWVWVMARPLLLVVIFAVFRNLSRANVGVEIDYILYLYSGLLLWFFFSDAVGDTATAIRAEHVLISKVYYPRILAPMAAIGSAFVRLGIGLLPLAVMMPVLGEYPGWRFALLPAALLQVGLLIFGIGCLFTSLGMASADWERFLTFAIYVGLFVSPVIYAPDLLPEAAKVVYSLNPLVGTLLAFRSALFDGFPWPQWEFAYAMGFSIVTAVVGVAAFQWTEKYFVDRG